MQGGREDGARDARQGARARRAEGESPKRDVNPLPPKLHGKRSAYGQAPRIGRGVSYTTSATNGRGTGRRGACGDRATRGIAQTRHNVVSAKISASEEPRTARAGSSARRCRVKNGRLTGSDALAQALVLDRGVAALIGGKGLLGGVSQLPNSIF